LSLKGKTDIRMLFALTFFKFLRYGILMPNKHL
jgi:hypothetical protein